MLAHFSKYQLIYAIIAILATSNSLALKATTLDSELGKEIDYSCTCGGNIDNKLRGLLVALLEGFQSKSREEKRNICRQVAQGQIDNSPLVYAQENAKTAIESCGPINTICSGTVTYNNKCYFAGEVNYITWGFAHHMCHHEFGGYTLIEAKAKTVAHRIGIVVSFLDLDVSKKIYGNIEKRNEWTQFGWDFFEEGAVRLRRPGVPEPSNYFAKIENTCSISLRSLSGYIGHDGELDYRVE